jgi:hypothetical protein
MGGEAMEGRKAGRTDEGQKRTPQLPGQRLQVSKEWHSRCANHSPHAACAIIGTCSMLSPMVKAPRQPTVEAWVPGSNEGA